MCFLLGLGFCFFRYHISRFPSTLLRNISNYQLDMHSKMLLTGLIRITVFAALSTFGFPFSTLVVVASTVLLKP